MTRYHVRRDPPLPWIVVVALILHLFPFDDTTIGILADATSSTSSSTLVEESANLVFSTQCQLLSQPLCQDAKELRHFLERDEIRDLFLSAGGERSCQTVPKDETMMSLYREACTRYYGPDALPSSSSSVEEEETMDMLATETTAQFPALKIITTVVNVCRRVAVVSSLVGSSSDHPHSFGLGERIFHHQRRQQQQASMNSEQFQGPVHRFYLIADRKRWEGPKAVVWLVRKLTGDDSHKDTTTTTTKKSFQSSETRAVTQISVVAVVPSSPEPSILEPTTTNNNNETPETNTTHYGFQVDIDCAVRIEFPKLLLRLLPASRTKVEERGTKAVHDALLKDASAALEAVQDAWRREQEQQSTNPQRHEEEQSSRSKPRLGWSWGSVRGSKSV